MPIPPLIQKIPLFLDLSLCRVLLVGGGKTATAKLRPLREAGATILSVAIRHHEGFLEEALRLGGVELVTGPFSPQNLQGIRLVVSATDDSMVNAQVAQEARLRGIFCNAVDDPQACDVFFAASIRRGPWHLAIGTEGAFPGLSRVLREVLEQLIPESHGSTLLELASLRHQLRSALPHPNLRRQALDRLLRAFRRTYFLPKEYSA